MAYFWREFGLTGFYLPSLMCTEYEPEERASAREVSDYLEGVWEKMNRKS